MGLRLNNTDNCLSHMLSQQEGEAYRECKISQF